MKYILIHYRCKALEEGMRVTCFSNLCGSCDCGKYPTEEDIHLGYDSSVVDLSPKEVYDMLKHGNGVVLIPYDKNKRYKTWM